MISKLDPYELAEATTSEAVSRAVTTFFLFRFRPLERHGGSTSCTGL